MVFTRTNPNYEILRPDFLRDYPNSKEELDPHFPSSFGPLPEQTFLVDSDHGHDQVTRKSLTGLLGFVGSTPSTWFSRRQGCIASSTYAAEFSALHTVTEEAIAMRYMLQCLGCNIGGAGERPAKICCDNFSVIQNS